MDSLPWVEKYRPKSIDQVVYQEEVVRTLKKSLETGNLPHLLFHGPPGTGKTSTILAVAHQLFGPEMFHERVMELNASDERGIDVVRNKVKNFARVTANSTSSGEYPCPNFKIIVLDEADSMTPDAQAALRRTMELYVKSTRFCLICNYVSRIIDPIASRCARYPFKPLSAESTAKHIRKIADAESLSYDDDVVDTIVKVSSGDMRKAITLLQSAYRLYAGKLTAHTILHIAGVVPDKLLHNYLSACKSKSFEKVHNIIYELEKEGYSTEQVLYQIHEVLLSSKDYDDLQKASIAEVLASAHHALLDGADETLQLLRVSSVITQA